MPSPLTLRRCRRGKGPRRRQRRTSRDIPCRASFSFSLCSSEASQREHHADEHPQRHSFQVISAALFAVMSALIRQLGARYPVGQVVFYRSVFALIPVVLVYAWRGELAAVVRTERPLGRAGRGV